MIGILDACLYSKKEMLKAIFSTLYITADVFNELKTKITSYYKGLEDLLKGE